MILLNTLFFLFDNLTQLYYLFVIFNLAQYCLIGLIIGSNCLLGLIIGSILFAFLDFLNSNILFLLFLTIFVVNAVLECSKNHLILFLSIIVNLQFDFNRLSNFNILYELSGLTLSIFVFMLNLPIIVSCKHCNWKLNYLTIVAQK